MKTLLLRCALGLVLCAPAAYAADPATDAVKAEIWAKEQSIYAGRGRGDMKPYIANLAAGYLSWPPTSVEPMDGTVMKPAVTSKDGKLLDKEKLEMTLRGFTLHGDVAMIYYSTLRTMRSDGTPAQDRFEVTHTWVREKGEWHVLGGLAREMAKP